MKNFTIISILFFVVALLSGCSYSPKATINLESVLPNDIPTNIEELSIEELQAISVDSFEIQRNPQNGIPRQIDGSFDSIKVCDEHDAVSCIFSVRSIMNIPDNASFSLTNIDNSSNEYTVYTFNQTYNGIAVTGGTFRVIARKNDNSLVSIYGVYKNGIDIDVTPFISYTTGAKKASVASNTHISSCQLVIYENEKEFLLSWKYCVDSNDPSKKSYVYIDAKTGQFISIIPTAIS